MNLLSQFFERQMDYLYLVYGLAFFILGLISLSQVRAKRLKLPWWNLVGFGVLLGFSEWEDLLELSFGSSLASSILHLVLLATSLVFLLEFGRQGLKNTSRWSVGPWIHIPLLALAGLGGLAGIDGLDATFRYTYGLVGGLGAAMAFYHAARWTKAPLLKMVAILMAAYAVTLGMVVPGANFPPASLLNQTSFQNWTGVPIQLLRLGIIFTVAFLIWLYDQMSLQALNFRVDRREQRTFISLFFVVLLAILCAGWFITDYAGRFADQSLRQDLFSQTNLAKASINRTRFANIKGDIIDLYLPDYSSLRRNLMIVMDSDAKLRDIFLMKLRDGNIVFAVDGRRISDPAFVNPGTVYQSPPSGLQSIFSGKATQIIGPYADEHGRFVSCFTPITDDATGKLIGVLGISISAADFQMTIARYRLIALMITLLCFVLATAFFIFSSKTRESALRIERSERNLAVAQALANIGSWTWNLTTNELNWSEEMYRIFGQPVSKPVRTYFDFCGYFPPAEWEKFAVALQKALQTGQDVAVETGIVRPDNSQRTITTLVTVGTDENKKPVQMLGITRDITEQKEADEQVRKLSRAIEQSPVSIVITDPDGKIEYVNPHFSKLTGYSLKEAIGNNPRILKTGETSEIDYRHLWETIMAGKVWQGEFHNRKKNGDLYWESAVISPVFDENQQVTHFVAVKEDITERKLASLELQRMHEELEKTNIELAKASEVKSQFLANMSHEIRTPLNAIIGMTGLLLDTPLNPEQHNFADTVRTSGEVLLTLINDILDFSKIEAQRTELEEQSFDLRRCIEEALDLTAPRASEKKIELAYMIENDLPTHLVGDVTRLRQILVNLLSNAVKFTEKGEVVISVEGQIRDNRQFQLHFSVRDTGMGIPPDRINRLFQSFSQIDASTTRKFGGTGLGLAISKRLSELMGGTMWAESSGVPGEGSTFHFTILAREAATQTPEPVESGPVDLSGLRVMIVDDNKTNREILLRYMDSWKMKPTAFESGPKALAQLQAGATFDLAILDMQMPEMDGMTLCRSIHDLLKEKTFPTILLSSLGYRRTDGDETIFSAYLTKPIKPSLLFDCLGGAVNHRKGVERKNFVTPSATFDREMGCNHPLRLLVVEDNTVNQTVALSLLGRIGYRADIASNGIEALQALERQTYDVVFMDGQMPEMDGEEATRQIRRRLPAERQPRIVAMTANAMQGDRERYLSAGMDDYISKPIRIEELVRALSNSRPINVVVAGEADAEAAAGVEPPTRLPPELATTAQEEPLEQNSIRAALNPAALQEFEELMGESGADMVSDLVALYLRDSVPLIAEMRESAAQANFEALRRAAHTLKGNSNQVGAVPLAESCAALEKLARAFSLEGADQLLAQIEVEYQRATSALQDFVRVKA